MKVSEITVWDVAKYIKLDDIGMAEEDELLRLIDVAKAFIRSETGLTDDKIDEHDDFYIVVLILCQDMYDNRSLYVEKSNVNKVVDTILGMHRVNLV